MDSDCLNAPAISLARSSAHRLYKYRAPINTARL